MAYNTAEKSVGGNSRRLKTKLPIDDLMQKSPVISGVIIGLGIFDYKEYDLHPDFIGAEANNQ